MAHEPDIGVSETTSLSRNGLYHCKIGQETVHDIVAKTTELFNHLKTTNAALQRTAENESKRAKIKDILSSIQHKMDALRRHYNNVNEICSSLAYVNVKSLIPFKDDPDNVEQILKHRRNLRAESNPDSLKEKEDLIKKITERDDQLSKVTSDLRNFIYEINTMLHVSKSKLFNPSAGADAFKNNPSRRGSSQEYLLQGSVLDDSVDILLHRLRGMCDNSEDGLTQFKEHQIVYSMREANGSGIVSVRVRKHLNHPDQPWLLCYLGNPELGDRTRPTIVRTCIEVNCTQNLCTFLQDLGFVVEFEFVSQGWLFKRNRLKATVAKICRMMQPSNTEQLTPLTKSHLVEVSMISSSGNEQAANEVHSFSEHLRPLVILEKLDPKRFGL